MWIVGRLEKVAKHCIIVKKINDKNLTYLKRLFSTLGLGISASHTSLKDSSQDFCSEQYEVSF